MERMEGSALTHSAPEQVVIIAVDSSQHAERAFNYYCDHLHRHTHRVILVHGADFPNPRTGQQHTVWHTADVWELESKKKDAEMKSLQNFYTERMYTLGINGQTHFVYHSNPGELVSQVAQHVKATLVITGARGLGTLRRTVLGSISDYIVDHASAFSAVLVCPPPRKGIRKCSYDHTVEQRRTSIFKRLVLGHFDYEKGRELLLND